MKCPLCERETSYLNAHLREAHGLSWDEIKEIWKKIPPLRERRPNVDYGALGAVFKE